MALGGLDTVERAEVQVTQTLIKGKDYSREIEEAGALLYKLAFVYNSVDKEGFDTLTEAIAEVALVKGRKYAQSPVWIREWDGRNLEK